MDADLRGRPLVSGRGLKLLLIAQLKERKCRPLVSGRGLKRFCARLVAGGDQVARS